MVVDQLQEVGLQELTGFLIKNYLVLTLSVHPGNSIIIIRFSEIRNSLINDDRYPCKKQNGDGSFSCCVPRLTGNSRFSCALEGLTCFGW